MDLSIHATFLPHTDPDAALAFYRDALGLKVRNDVGDGTMRWITVGPAGRPETSIVLEPPAATPEFSEDDRRAIEQLMAKGVYGWLVLATPDLDAVFERLHASGVEVVHEPTDQDWGVRDCSVRDPAGNHGRIQELG